MNKKRSLLITALFSIFLTLITGTMSYLIWQTSDSKRTFISFTVPNMCSVSVDGGGNINAGSVNMYPAVCTDTNATIVKEITLEVEFQESAADVLVELWLNAKDIDSALSNSDNFRYTVSRSSSNCYDSVISTGSLKGVQQGGSVKIFEETYAGVYPEIKTDKLYLYIWLDEAETNVATAGANFSLSLGGNCSSVAISTGTVAKPVLDDGMIPVTIANNGTVTTVSEDDSSWYNYDNKQWANMILVDRGTETDRITDYSGNNTTATLNGPTLNDNGLKFDGTDDEVSLPNIQISSLTGFTVETEIMFDNYPSGKVDFISSYEAGGFGIEMTAAGIVRFAIYDVDSVKYVIVSSDFVLEAGKRYLTTGVYDGEKIYLYINGEFISSASIGTIGDSTTFTALGCNPYTTGSCHGNYFNGTMFSSRFYNRSLSSDEILNNYNGNIVKDNLRFYYDFENGKRTTYKNSTGVTVDDGDILAYYTWIPRYKYKIWDVTGTSSAQSIEIEFESSAATPVLGTAVGEWRTHPSFIWDGNPISGIWVGKFETTGSESTPTILPNQTVLSAQSVSSQFTTALKFAGGTFNTSTGEVSFSGSNVYGLTTNVDGHMMKNSDWGAAAYLSHSQYGINSEVRANQYVTFDDDGSVFVTGCGSLDEYEYSDNCEMAYGTQDSYPQSTTGNITGIFDMVGGGLDVVMGNFNNSISNSEFTVLPISKYYDKYTNTSSVTTSSLETLTACDGGICYGHSLSETAAWNDGYDGFAVVQTQPWLGRGSVGGYYDESVGIWTFEGVPGSGTFGGAMNEILDYPSWRSVIVPLVSTGPVDATISSTNNMSNSQSVTLSWDENSEVVSYSWGTTHPYTTTDWNDTTASSVTETVNEPGTYYLGLKDSSGNITVVKKNFYETKFSVSNGTVSTNSYITMEGNSITLPEVTVNDGYVFFGWYTRDNGAGNKLENTYTPTYSSTIYANIKSNILTITYYTDGGVLTDSTSDGTNTYNWSQEVNGLVKLNDVVYEDVYAYGQEVKLTKFNDSNYMNITKENYDAVSKSEWTCFDGCDELDKVFNQIDTYTTDDFCDVSDGPCTIKLKVNWVYSGN